MQSKLQPEIITFANIYHSITVILQKYGLSTLEKDEKEIFYFIISSKASGNQVSIPEIVDRNLTSRASTYRHLNSLISQGLIKIEGHGRKQAVIIDSRFKNFEKDFRSMINKLKKL